jgi:hypothetical protein
VSDTASVVGLVIGTRGDRMFHARRQRCKFCVYRAHLFARARYFMGIRKCLGVLGAVLTRHSGFI